MGASAPRLSRARIRRQLTPGSESVSPTALQRLYRSKPRVGNRIGHELYRLRLHIRLHLRAVQLPLRLLRSLTRVSDHIPVPIFVISECTTHKPQLATRSHRT